MAQVFNLIALGLRVYQGAVNIGVF